jgi:hypothetical protein
MTIALLKTSAGYQQGSSLDDGTPDQRGFTRPKNNCSIGAYDPDATGP